MAVIIVKKQGVVADPIRIDKVSMTLPIHGTKHAAVLSNMEKLVKDAYAYETHTPGYFHSIWVVVGHAGERRFLVQAGAKWPNAAFLRVEFNPAKDPMAEVHTMLNFIVPGGYQTLVAAGKCTRVDIAVDVHMARPAQLLVTHEGIQVSRLHAKSGTVTGYELGSRESGAHFNVYDKGLQLKKENANTKWKVPLPDHPITRIEVWVKESFPVSKLVGLSNPFAKLKIADLGDIAGKDDDARIFMLAALGVGAQTVLSSVSAPRRKVLQQRLSEASAVWWNPAACWQAWPEEAEKVLTPPPPAYAYDPSFGKSPAVMVGYSGAESHLAH
jgi:hypothetical protein